MQHNTRDGKLDKIDAVWVKAATATTETNTERRDSTQPGQNQMHLLSRFLPTEHTFSYLHQLQEQSHVLMVNMSNVN